MCGISGIISNNKIDQKSIFEMTSLMTHRGPDTLNIYQHNKVNLGHTRLSIIDTSSSGNQPFISNCSNYIITYNGELYNFKEIRSRLNYAFQSRTDTEVILAAYIEWGSECLKYFNGMFSFVIYDKIKNELFAARDRMGIKPFYYYYDQNHFIFSSEIRPILNSRLVKKKTDLSLIYEFLKYQTIHSPRTIISNIKSIQAGHYFIISLNDKIEFSSHEYWKPKKIDEISNLKYPEIKTKIEDTLYDAVKKRLISDVPMGAFLSGGVDSSVIVSLMARASSSKVKTFNIGFNEKNFDESKYARIIADKYNTDHTELILSSNDFFRNIENGLNDLDHPTADGLNTWMVTKLAKNNGITVAMSGLGGDELFCGYSIFKRAYQLEKYKTSIKGANKILKQLLKKQKSISQEKIYQLLSIKDFDIFDITSINRQSLSNNWLERIFLNETFTSTSYNDVELHFKNKDFLMSNVSQIELGKYMQNILLRDLDQMGMAHALEARVPFLDHNVVELALSIKDKLKYPLKSKQLLIESFTNNIPRKIYDRPKQGFVLPWEEWLKNDLKDFTAYFINNFANREYINRTAVITLWNDFLTNKSNVNYSRIWSIVILENYLSKFKIDLN